MKYLTHSESSMISLDQNNIAGRTFGYEMNKKRAKAKLLKGAKRDNHLDVELRSGCANMRFSNGSYFELILPLLRDWNTNMNKSIKIDDTEVEILEVEAGKENQGHHVDTKLVVIVNNDRLVLHAYNGTQNLMVQGKNYDKFAINCLEPFFRRKIESNIDKITLFNNGVKETLGGKKSIKSAKPYNCPQCGVKASTIGDLKLHTKRCHTKPNLDSPKRRKVIKTLDEDMSVIDVSGVFPLNMPDIEDLIICEYCDKDMTDQDSLKDHMMKIHCQGGEMKSPENGIGNKDLKEIEMVVKSNDNIVTSPQAELEQSISICGECAEEFSNENECSEHIANNHVRKSIIEVEIATPPRITAPEDKEKERCEICPFCNLASKDLNHLRKHIENIHMRGNVFNSQDVIHSENEMNKHIQTEHKSITTDLPVQAYLCESCDLDFGSSHLIQEHMTAFHSEHCEYCSFKAATKEGLQDHTVKEHKEVFILHKMGAQVNNLTQEFVQFKAFNEELANLFKKLCESFDGMKKELADVKKTQVNDASKDNIKNKVEEVVHPKNAQKRKTKYLKKPKVLYIGDSLAHNADIAWIEKETQCRIRTKKAYSSNNDNNAIWPEKNFVVASQVALAETHPDDKFSHIILSAPTVDISNLDTAGLAMNDDVEVFKQKVKLSCENMVSIATNTMIEHPEIENVTIMEHAPRHDTVTSDPTGLKPRLAIFANETIEQMLNSSPMKDRIMIGKHNLSCSDNMVNAMYRSDRNGRYDGVQFYGSLGQSLYTSSVLNIFRAALPPTQLTSSHVKCEQAIYQKNKSKNFHHKSHNSNYSVPVMNRFNVLGN